MICQSDLQRCKGVVALWSLVSIDALARADLYQTNSERAHDLDRRTMQLAPCRFFPPFNLPVKA